MEQKGRPLSSLIAWDPADNLLTTVDCHGPSLSHHTGNIVRNILVLVGGWDGKNRSSTVHAFNLQTKKWIKMDQEEERSNPPFGLSGHSTTMINTSLACVLGREGGLKIQRKFGDIFMLHLKLEPEGGSFWWTEAPVKTKSRSGHAALLAPSLKFGDVFGLFVFGGRDDESIHKCGQWPVAEVDIQEEDNEEVFKSLTEVLEEEEASKPEGLRYHTMARINSRCILVQGGENFKSRNNISSKTLVCMNRKGISQWFSLDGGKDGARSAHGMVVMGDTVYVVGGMNGTFVKGDVARLQFIPKGSQ